MARNKFLKKIERNPIKEALFVIFLLIIILALFVFSVRYFLSIKDVKPFLTQSEKQLDYLSFTLYTPKLNYTMADDDIIDINMIVKNISNKPIELNFPYSIEVDFLAYRLDNFILFEIPTLVWTYSIEQKSIKKPHSMIIQPNESKIFAAKWNKKTQKGVNIKGGNYRIIGKMETRDFNISLSLGRQ
jgi:hypothetical protein